MNSYKHCFMGALIFAVASSTHADPLGNARMNAVSPTGGVLGAAPPVVDLPMTGSLDVDAGVLAMTNASIYKTTDIELLVPGFHSRSDGGGGTIDVVVGPEQLGAYLIFNYGAAADRKSPMFAVWDASPYSNGVDYESFDADGDGTPGWRLTTGLLAGYSIWFDFYSGSIPPPNSEGRVLVDGVFNVDLTDTRECAAINGTEVALELEIAFDETESLALPTTWFIDGQIAGSPTATGITTFLSLGEHDIHAQSVVLIETPTGVTGEIRNSNYTVTIVDTTAPSVDIVVIDSATGLAVTEAFDGEHTVFLEASDICDPSPATSGMAIPIYDFKSGDSIEIGSGLLPFSISAISMSATVTDASGNNSTTSTILNRIE